MAGNMGYCGKLGAEIMRDGGLVIKAASVSRLITFHGQPNYSGANALSR
jgi:hypothetical protein